MYYIKGTMDVERTQGRGTEYWKQQWGVDSVLQNKHGDRQVLYFCDLIINAEFEDIWEIRYLFVGEKVYVK